MEIENTAQILVEFQPIGRRIEVDSGTNLLNAAQLAGIDLVAACGGMGICKTCLVRIVKGKINSPGKTETDLLTEEKLQNGYRLACRCIPASDTCVEIPPESLPNGQKFQLEGPGIIFRFNPDVIMLDLFIKPPSITDLRSDFSRISDEVEKAGIPNLKPDYDLLRSLSNRIRDLNWNMRAVIRRDQNYSTLISILPPGADILGAAVDIGSTKVAIYLVNMQTGVTIAQKGIPNPQISFGEDVISRVTFANKSPRNQEILQNRLINAVNEALSELCNDTHHSTDQIIEAVFVGNTAIHHLTCRLPVRQLGLAPYVAAISEPIEIMTKDIGLNICPGAKIFFPSIIAGFVGADHTSALLATRFERKSGIRMLIDIGTNTEISLGINGKIFSCSTASGPAFEGAHIHDGMRASPGAIEKVKISNGKNEVLTVGEGAPIGICGTGILQAIAELLKNNIITPQGTFRKQQPNVKIKEGRAVYELIPANLSGNGRDIVITRKDVNEIQLAKAAIRAGIEILLLTAGITAFDVQEWIIAGAFGTYLDLDSAIKIGMFPDVPVDCFSQLGNAAGTGAKQMLLSQDERATVSNIIDRVQYIELTACPEFTKYYVDFMNF